MAILDEWVRFWFRGELLPLPADLLRSLDETRQQLLQAQAETQQARVQARQAMEQLDKERQEKERLQAKLRELGIDPTKV